MRATRRKMDAYPGSVLLPDEGEWGEQYSATSGDYFMADMDEDVGGRLAVKVSYLISPDLAPALRKLVSAWLAENMSEDDES